MRFPIRVHALSLSSVRQEDISRFPQTPRTLRFLSIVEEEQEQEDVDANAEEEDLMSTMPLLVPLLLSRKKKFDRRHFSPPRVLLICSSCRCCYSCCSCSYSYSYSSFECVAFTQDWNDEISPFYPLSFSVASSFSSSIRRMLLARKASEAFLCLLRLCLLLAAAAFGREDILGVTRGALEEEQQPASRRRRRRIPPRKGEEDKEEALKESRNNDKPKIAEESRR